LVILRVFMNKDPEDATPRNRAGTAACEGGYTRRKIILVEETFAASRKNPAYVKAYNALEEECSLAKAMIEALAHASLTQQLRAERRNLTQVVIARLESGCVKPSPGTRVRLAVRS
jgi:hypothetical protein